RRFQCRSMTREAPSEWPDERVVALVNPRSVRFESMSALRVYIIKSAPSAPGTIAQVHCRNMDWQLDAAEARVLGSLLEKEVATPEYYPLSLNALVNACNQKSNREPVVSFDEDTVEVALEGLRANGLALRSTGRDSRVPKHAQRFTEKFNFGRREAAVVCVLLLRGPQTTGELRGRTERLYTFDDLEGVASSLQRLAEIGFT